jgi:hypothetical protein
MPQEIELRQVAPGDYRATLIDLIPGTYLVQVNGHVGTRMVGQAESGLVVPYSSEYRPNQNDPELLAALAAATGGGPLDDPVQAFAHNLDDVTRAQEVALPLLLLALLLLPFDIAARRLLLLQSGVQRAGQWFRRQHPPRPDDVIAEPPVSPTLERLAQARNRAVAREKRHAAPPSETPPATEQHANSAAPEPAPRPPESSTLERLAQARSRASARTTRRASPPADEPPEPPSGA